MSGNSQGPTGFLPGMFKEEVVGENKHSKDDGKSSKVLNEKKSDGARDFYGVGFLFQSKKKKKDKKKHKHKHKHHKHKKESNREGKHSHPASPATPLNAKDETLSSGSSSPSQASQDVAF